MCQQWFSVAGLILDICGFLLIAREWWHAYQHNILMRDNAVETDFILTRDGEDAAKSQREADASMWRNTIRESRIDNARRKKLFVLGVFLVIVGFIGQMIGSLPYGQSYFLFRSCS